MTINTSGYTVASNLPLNHARILWNMIEGTVTGDGNNPQLAANDLTAQRWTVDAGSWVLETAADAQVDCVFIAAHNLAGKAVTIGTSAATSGSFTTRASFTPPDNTTICALFNTGTGVPHTIRRIQVTVAGSNNAVGIIRAGVALQMQRAMYGGHGVANWSRVTEGQQQFSETGQWLGRMEKRIALEASYSWEHLTAPWYRDNFEPFARTLPLRPFGIAGNPSAMPDDVVWGWTSQDLRPSNMGVRNYVQVSMSVTGYR
jgi:hypothetical protein